jgi:CRISPR-associated protein Csx17
LASQAPEARVRGYWKNDVFVLETEWTRAEILDFFLNHYAPTPVIAPWNGGSGFYPKDQKSGIDAVSQSAAPRFAALRETIRTAKAVLARLGISEKSADRKAELLDACRAELPDEALNWLDCAYVLTEGGPKYPALLGTGGNDGRLDFTNNYLQRMAEVFGLAEGEAPASSPVFLRGALFGDAVPGLGGAAIGQFSPLASGGANTSSAFEGSGNVNPWNFILMLEGAMSFAAAATKRLGSIMDGRLAFPFCVRPKSVGYGSSADAETGGTRCEMWMPLWGRPASHEEIHALFAEGRVQVMGCNRQFGGLQAQDAVDFYRAIAALGIDRGVTAFQRYAFQMRNGLAYFAVALDRVPVVAHGEVQALLSPIDQWMQKLRGKAADENAPASVKLAVRRLDEAVIALATQGASVAMGLLETLGECDAALGNSLKWAKEQKISPLAPLSPKWLEFVGEGASGNKTEARLAASLASLNTYFGKSKGSLFMPLRGHLVPVDISNWKDRAASAKWLETDSNNLVWGGGSLLDSLLAVMGRRLILAGMKGESALPQGSAVSAYLSDVAQFIDGGVDDAAMEAMLRGLCLIDWRYTPELEKARSKFLAAVVDDGLRSRVQPPLAYSLLRLCYTPRRREHPEAGYNSEAPAADTSSDGGHFDAAIPLVPMIFNRAAAGDGTAALELAARRLRASGLAPVTPVRWRDDERRAFGIGASASRRIAAALLFPISQPSYDALAKRALRRGEGDTSFTSTETEHEITPA